MSEHLAIKVLGQYATLPQDFEIDIEDVNPLFNDYDSYSYDVSLPIDSNRHIFKDIDAIRSDKRLVDIEGEDIQIIVDGVPFRSGMLQTVEDEQIEDSISLSMQGKNKSIKDAVADLQLQDVPVKDKIQIGEMIGNVHVEGTFDYYVEIKLSNPGKKGESVKTYTTKSKPGSITGDFELQALGFSYPGICEISPQTFEIAKPDGGKPKVLTSFINVTDEYPTKVYCNGRVCYTHYEKEEGEDGEASNSDTVSTEDKFDPYFILEADRAQSGICFYVLYVLDCIFAYLGMIYDNSRLLSVGDFKRLCFFTTHCKYNIERKYPNEDEDLYDFDNLESINTWFSSRFTNGKLEVRRDDYIDIESALYSHPDKGDVLYEVGKEYDDGYSVSHCRIMNNNFNYSVKANIMNMYANSENFPNMSVSAFLDSLWASFGIKFIENQETKTVEPFFIRDVFRDTTAPIKLNARLTDICKISEKITGVRMKYSEESDKEEQLSNIRYGVKDYNTDYDYIDYSNVNSSKTYQYIIKQRGASDRTCYIDMVTGNAYRLKVDKDATKASELKPAVFEVGGYKGVEIGDCSNANEDFVIELTSDFIPLIFNDVNGRYERNVGDEEEEIFDYEDEASVTASSFNISSKKQILCAFVDEDMRHENQQFVVNNAMGNNHINAYLTEVCTTNENYDPSKTEDGNSPLQEYDWGAALTLMRGGGSNAEIQYYDYDYDGCGNRKWRMVAADYSMSTDCIDNWGTDFDYNGVTEGIGEDERFSLKIRAFKVVNGEILCQDDEKDENNQLTRKIRHRGLFDTFMSEYAQFLLNRKKLRIEFTCELAEILNIQWYKRYQIGEYIFWWDKLSYSISAKDGLGVVSAEVYML